MGAAPVTALLALLALLTSENTALARAMREEGKTLQEIADELGYKSRSSVMNLLKE